MILDIVKEPHIAISTGFRVGKPSAFRTSSKVSIGTILNLFCPTIRWNSTYLERASLWKDEYVFFINFKDQLFEWIDKLSSLLAGEESFFIVDDCIADENLEKRRQPLLEIDWKSIKAQLRKSKHTYLYVRLEHPKAIEFCSDWKIGAIPTRPVLILLPVWKDVMFEPMETKISETVVVLPS